MNTRNAYALRAARAAASQPDYRPNGHLGKKSPVAPTQVRINSKESTLALPASLDLNERVCRHPLADGVANARLANWEASVKARFDVIVPTLKAASALQHEPDFATRAQALAQGQLGYSLPGRILEDAWIAGLDLKALYAYCTFAALKASAAQFAEDLKNHVELVQDTRNFFLDCGFHGVDISPCSDGRLKGLMRYILRMPLTSFSRRKAYAGALFDIETDVRHWVSTELRRFREGVPTTIDAGTRYLKIAVYHTSSSHPCTEGCAAHGSNENRAIEAALERLNQFRQAIENAFCCGASTDLLLVGVDTDTDAIKVHVPDVNGNISANRYVDNAKLYQQTLNLNADEARLAVYNAISNAGSDNGLGGQPHEGMQRLIANLIINNLSQIEYVNDLYGGRYPDIDHAERYISVGDGIEEVQIRNVAYYAHLHTVEEGAADLDVGIKIFKSLNVKRGLPIPIAIHYRYDTNVPGSRQRALLKTRRIRDAIRSRYSDLYAKGLLICHLSIQDLPAGSPIEEVEGEA